MKKKTRNKIKMETEELTEINEKIQNNENITSKEINKLWDKL